MMCQDKIHLGCLSQPASFKLIMLHQPFKLQEICFLQQVGSLAMGIRIIFSYSPPLSCIALVSEVQPETCWVSQSTASSLLFVLFAVYYLMAWFSVPYVSQLTFFLSVAVSSLVGISLVSWISFTALTENSRFVLIECVPIKPIYINTEVWSACKVNKNRD